MAHIEHDIKGNNSIDNEDNIEISIVIPYYNDEEEYIVRCLNSIISNSFSRYEIVVINDGSDYNHTQMLERVCDCKKKIRIVNKENGGVSEARNYGVELSRGRYIVFVDADDIVSTSFLENAYKLIENNSVDMVIGGCVATNGITLDNEDIFEHKTIIFPKDQFTVFRNSFISSNYRFGNIYLGSGCWARIIRKEIALKTKFPSELKIGEDVIWNQIAFNNCDSVILTSQLWYYHCDNAQSVTHSYDKNNINTVKQMYGELYKHINLSDKKTYLSVMERLYSDTHWHICKYYLTHKKLNMGILNRYIIFKKMLSSEPWSDMDRRFWKHESLDWKLRYLLLKSGLIFFIFLCVDRK